MKPAREPDFEAVDVEAARWAVYLEYGAPTPAEHAALGRWLEENPAHRWSFSRYRHLAAELEVALPALLGAGRIERPETLAGRPRRTRVRPFFAGWGVLGTLGAAAALAVVFWVGREPSVPLAAVPSTVTPEAGRVYATGIGERKSVPLADGSRVDLNAATHLEAAFAPAERRVRLTRGEGFFNVAKDAARPFVIETPGGRVRVTGTSFNVLADPAGESEVAVVTGTVEVASGGVSLRLGPGERAILDARLGFVRRASPRAAAEATAWREGRMVLDDTPLAEALARLARFHGMDVTVDPACAGVRLGGRYSLEDAEDFLRALAEAAPVRVKRDAGGAVYVTAR